MRTSAKQCGFSLNVIAVDDKNDKAYIFRRAPATTMLIGNFAPIWVRISGKEVQYPEDGILNVGSDGKLRCPGVPGGGATLPKDAKEIPIDQIHKKELLVYTCKK